MGRQEGLVALQLSIAALFCHADCALTVADATRDRGILLAAKSSTSRLIHISFLDRMAASRVAAAPAQLVA